MKRQCHAVLLAVLLWPGWLLASDGVLTIESTISAIGDAQEQPRILVIVPWQATPPASADLDGGQHHDDAGTPFLQPLERKSFIRRNRLLEQFRLPPLPGQAVRSAQ